jgi:hypothetical protein
MHAVSDTVCTLPDFAAGQDLFYTCFQIYPLK